MSVYDFSATRLDGHEESLVRLSRQGASDRQHRQPVRLHARNMPGWRRFTKSMRPRASPCWAFPATSSARQEPGGEAEIGAFCETNYGVTFPMFAKIEVNGERAHPLYKYLKDAKPGLLGSEAIKWNFTKFLIGRDGEPVARYAPQTKPEELEAPIRELL